MILAAMLLTACAKEPPVASTVTMDAAGVWCAIEVVHNGTVARDTIGAYTPPDSTGAMAQYSTTFTAAVGDRVSITATSLQPSGLSVLASIKVDGHAQGFDFRQPVDSGQVATVNIAVPELDRWGGRK